MRGLKRYNKKYFAKYRDNPVDIKPFDPKTREIAYEYMAKIDSLLSEFKIKSVLRGSTAFGIAGKGEIEIGIYPSEGVWFDLIIFLTNHFKSIGNLEDDYARFNDNYKNRKVEVILMKGHQAEVDKKLFEYLMGNLLVLKKYEDLKKKYAYSKRNYMQEKHKFFNDIVRTLPD